jgi:hypothetical protein
MHGMLKYYSKYSLALIPLNRMCQHHTYVFTDVDTRRLPISFFEKVSKSRVCAIMGPSEAGTTASGMSKYTDVECTRKVRLHLDYTQAMFSSQVTLSLHIHHN